MPRVPGGGNYGPSSAQTAAKANADIQRQLRRLQEPGAGMDFFGLASPQGVAGFQEPLPALDFRWTWRNDRQQGFAFTVNSNRGGLNMQRGRIELAHLRLAAGSLSTHARDEAILPFDTETQVNLEEVFSHYNMLHAHFQDREVMTPYMGLDATNTLYGETSSIDPTIIALQTLGEKVLSMGVARYQGNEYLAVCLGSKFVLYDTLDSGSTAAQTITSFVVTTGGTASAPNFGSGSPFGGFSIASPGSGNRSWGGFGLSAITVPGIPWGGGQTSTAYKAQCFIQSGLPGNPLIIRSSNAVLLAGTEDFSGDASLMLRNVGLGSCQPLGLASIGARPLRAWWWESNSGAPVSNGSFRSRITSTNQYGTDYQILALSISRILGCCLIPQRGMVAQTDGYRVTVYDGQEIDLGIFAGESPNAGFVSFCVGLYTLDGQLFAEVNELPAYESDVGFGEGVAQGRIRRCIRRYDFEIGKWFQVSEWNTLTESGLIRWNNGIPIPVADGATYGFMSAYGAPDLPFGRVTRAMHNYAVPARYAADLESEVSLPTEFAMTWHHKFEPPAATDPYALRDGQHPFASTGENDMPALIFPPGFEYLDKYLDEIEWGGQDTGGTSSKVTVYVAEGGRLDETNPPPLKVEFKHGLSHASRRVPFPANQTSLLFPQIRVKIDRGSDTNKTMQALPFTIHGHIDLDERDRASGIARWMPFGRSKG